MLPKIQQQPNMGTMIKKENIASQIILEDHLKNILAKSDNRNFKPWKNDQAPRNPHSAFGDFPKEKMPTDFLTTKKLTPIHEDS